GPRRVLSVPTRRSSDLKKRGLRWRSSSPAEAPAEKEQNSDDVREEELAQILQKYGKHKERFEAQQSIPGFWDLDMPSTQQVKERSEEHTSELQSSENIV